MERYPLSGRGSEGRCHLCGGEEGTHRDRGSVMHQVIDVGPLCVGKGKDTVRFQVRVKASNVALAKCRPGYVRDMAGHSEETFRVLLGSVRSLLDPAMNQLR